MVLLSSGCDTFVESHINHEPDTMLMPVLEDMVKNEDEDGKILRMVDLRSPQIDQLRQRCGPKYQIVSTYDSDNRQEGEVENGSREKVHIQTEVMRVNGVWAEVSAAYIYEGGFVSFRYKLRYKNGEWHILSCDFYAAT
jgi:hypothetical protein